MGECADLALVGYVVMIWGRGGCGKKNSERRTENYNYNSFVPMGEKKILRLNSSGRRYTSLDPLSFTHVTHFSLLFHIVLGISKLSQSRVIPRVQESQFAILVSTAPLRKAMLLALQVELHTGHHWASQLILNRWKWQWQDQCCRVSVARG